METCSTFDILEKAIYERWPAKITWTALEPETVLESLPLDSLDWIDLCMEMDVKIKDFAEVRTIGDLLARIQHRAA